MREKKGERKKGKNVSNEKKLSPYSRNLILAWNSDFAESHDNPDRAPCVERRDSNPKSV